MTARRRKRRPAKKHTQLLNRARPHYERMLEEQGGLCAICGRPPTASRRLDIDHDHTEMRVRGLLCPACNIRLGNTRSSEWLRRAADYLDRGRIDWLEAVLHGDVR